MDTCIFLRHGEVDNPKKVFYGRVLDIPLNNKGRIQIESITEKITELHLQITLIYSSPLLRALQTAKIIANKIDVSITPIQGLIDVDIPALTGKPLSLRKELHAKGEDEYSGIWVERGNETRDHIAQRMQRVFQRIKNENKNGFPIVVSHGDPLLCLLFSLENPNKKLPRIGELKKPVMQLIKDAELF